MPKETLKKKYFHGPTAIKKAGDFTEKKSQTYTVEWKGTGKIEKGKEVQLVQWYESTKTTKPASKKYKFKNQPGYVFYQSRWHSRKRLEREVDILEKKLLKARAPRIAVGLKNPTMYARVAWKDETKTNAAEVRLKLKGEYSLAEAIKKMRSRLEKHTGRLPDEPVGTSPGLFLISVGTQPLKAVTIEGQRVPIKYHYKPQTYDIMLGQGVKNLEGW